MSEVPKLAKNYVIRADIGANGTKNNVGGNRNGRKKISEEPNWAKKDVRRAEIKSM